MFWLKTLKTRPNVLNGSPIYLQATAGTKLQPGDKGACV